MGGLLAWYAQPADRAGPAADGGLRAVGGGFPLSLFARPPARHMAGAVGTLWMVGYWVVMPKWLFYIATQCATTS